MLRLEGGGPILNIEVGQFKVSKSRATAKFDFWVYEPFEAYLA
jgi:hypothetical protein